MSTFLCGANVHANGIRQHYLRYGGRGPNLILVPGITSPAVTWGFVAERLGKYYDVYVLDIRGRGLSSGGHGLDYGLDAQARDVGEFIRELSLRDVVILGHSMGARIAIRAAARQSLPLNRLVLVDPPVSGPGRRPYPSKLEWYVDSIRLAGAGMDAQAMRSFCPTWTEDQLRLRAEWLHTCFEPAIVQSYEDFHKDDVHSDLPHLKVPALLMVAGRGGVIEPQDEAEILKLQPNISISRVANAGHMIPWDDLEGFLEAVNAYLLPGALT